MSEERHRAFVLRSVTYGEERRICDLLSAEGEIITVSLSLAGQKRHLAALVQPFVLGDFQLRHYRERDYLQSGELVYSFPGLLADWDRLSALSQLASIVLDALSRHSALPQVYILWAYTAERISQSSQPALEMQMAAYRLLAILGFCPWLTDCVHCRQTYRPDMVFSFTAGGLFCPSHLPRSELAPAGKADVLPMSSGLRALLLYLAECDLPKLFSVRLSEQVAREFSAFADRWLERVMEKHYPQARFAAEMRRFSAALPAAAGPLGAEEKNKEVQHAL